MIDTPTPIVTMTTPATRHEMMITNSSEFVVKEPEDKKTCLFNCASINSDNCLTYSLIEYTVSC